MESSEESKEDKYFIDILNKCNEQHLFKNFDKATSEQKKHFFSQVFFLSSSIISISSKNLIIRTQVELRRTIKRHWNF